MRNEARYVGSIIERSLATVASVLAARAEVVIKGLLAEEKDVVETVILIPLEAPGEKGDCTVKAGRTTACRPQKQQQQHIQLGAPVLIDTLTSFEMSTVQSIWRPRVDAHSVLELASEGLRNISTASPTMSITVDRN